MKTPQPILTPQAEAAIAQSDEIYRSMQAAETSAAGRAFYDLMIVLHGDIVRWSMTYARGLTPAEEIEIVRTCLAACLAEGVTNRGIGDADSVEEFLARFVGEFSHYSSHLSNPILIHEDTNRS